MAEKILVLAGQGEAYTDGRIVNFLRDSNYDVNVRQEPADLDVLKQENPDAVISYGFRHIIKPDVIAQYPKIINLHISYLPWNRGTNPNFWSCLENTAKGYTIHHISEGIDTGDLLIQKRAEELFEDGETLASSYLKLRQGIDELFIANWTDILERRIQPQHQEHKGTFHLHRDLEQYNFLLERQGWETSLDEIKEYGRLNGLWVPQDK